MNRPCKLITFTIVRNASRSRFDFIGDRGQRFYIKLDAINCFQFPCPHCGEFSGQIEDSKLLLTGVSVWVCDACFQPPRGPFANSIHNEDLRVLAGILERTFNVNPISSSFQAWRLHELFWELWLEYEARHPASLYAYEEREATRRLAWEQTHPDSLPMTFVMD